MVGLVTGTVDIHAHVLPGIDDGPPTIEDAVAMVRAASAAGTRLQAATPHIHRNFPNVHPEEIAERLQAVREASADVDIELVSGGEVQITWAVDATPEQLKLVSYGQRGTDILLETPSAGIFGIPLFIGEIQAHGYRVVLAHPERGIQTDGDFARLDGLAARGVLLQVNAESLLAEDRKFRKLAQRLCTDGLASVIASDGHSGTQRRRVTLLAEGIGELRKLVGDERAAWMSSGVPGAVLAGQRLPPEPPVVARRRLFGRA